MSEEDGTAWPAEPAATGDDDVDAHLALLRHLPGMPVAGHGDLYAELHDGLRSTLDDLPPES